MSNLSTRLTILLVDDEAMILKTLQRLLVRHDWDIVIAESGAQALEIMAQRSIALLLTDQRMPEMNGLELLREVKASYPDTVRIVLTGYAEMDVVVKSINEGEVYRFLTKPWNNAELLKTVHEALQHYHEKMTRYSEITSQLELANLETVMALAEAIELKDHYTKGHCSRVRDYALRIAMALNLSDNLRRDLVYASILHDCGKIGVSESILNIDGPLNDEQYREVKRHPVLGFEMTSKIDYLRPASIIIRQHHERWDGTGYPDGIKADEISLGARIVAVADTFDAMTSSRPYRRALDFDVAVQELITNRGSQFDPEIVDLFVSLLDRSTPFSGELETPRRLLLVGALSEQISELANSLPATCYELISVATLAEARVLITSVDMVVCARHLEDGDVIDFLIACKHLNPQIIRIMLIARQDMAGMAETVNQAGLYAFMIYPLRPAEVHALVENAFEWQRMASVLHFVE